MYAFDYHKASSVREAAKLLKDNEEAKVLAGGQTFIPTLKQRLAAPEQVIDLNGIDELREIELTGRTVHIGAMARHADVAGSEELQETIPALAKLAGGIGDPHVRNCGTLGGSVANNDPSADYPAAVLAFGATVHTNTRKIAADDFFTGMFETALEEGELITKISFPVPKKAAYMKFHNPASRYALVGVCVVKRGSEVRVTVTGAGQDGVFRLSDAEEALAARFVPKSLDDLVVDPSNLNSEIHASAEYRAHLVKVMAKRAVAAAE